MVVPSVFTHVGSNPVSLLREWSYPSNEAETPVAVPVYNANPNNLPLGNTYPVQVMATAVINFSRRFTDQLQYYQKEMEQSYYVDSCATIANENNHIQYEANDTMFSPPMSLSTEDEEEMEDWEIIEEEERWVIHGELVDVSSEPQVSEGSSITSSRKGEYMTQEHRPRKYARQKKGCNFSVKEWLYKQRAKLTKLRNAKMRKQQRQQKHQQGQDHHIERAQIIGFQHSNRFDESNQGLSDRDIYDQLESIRNKIKQQEEEEANMARKRKNSRDDAKESSTYGEVEMTRTPPAKICDSESESFISPPPMESITPLYRGAHMEIAKIVEHRDNKSHMLRSLDKCKNVDSDLNDLAVNETDDDLQNSRIPRALTNTKQSIRVLPYSLPLSPEETSDDPCNITVNDMLKIVFVGTEKSGKTSIVRSICKQGEGRKKHRHSDKNSLLNVDVYKWDPTNDSHHNYEQRGNHYMDTKMVIEDASLYVDQEVNVQFNVWDFTGKQTFYASQELFYSPQSLYVIVWDMAKKNKEIWEEDRFSPYDSDDEDFESSQENLELLHDDIDENVQFWIDSIQRNAPGSVILIVGSFCDKLHNKAEAERKYEIMRKRLQHHEDRSIQRILKQVEKNNPFSSSKCETSNLLRQLYLNRPKSIFRSNRGNSLILSTKDNTGIDHLKETLVQIATGRYRGTWNYGLFSEHVGIKIPSIWREIRDIVEELRKNKHYLIGYGFFCDLLKKRGIKDRDDIEGALRFLNNVGEVIYFGKKKDCMHIKAALGHSESIPRLSQFICLKPKWLVHAILCIIRPDLNVQVKRIRSDCMIDSTVLLEPIEHFDNVSNPTISNQAVRLLWESNPRVHRTIVRAESTSNKISNISPYEFLKQMLIQFNVFAPINLHSKDHTLSMVKTRSDEVRFFLPSLLGSTVPSDDFFWYKSRDASTITLCHSWLFSDSVPQGILEQIMISSLRVLYKAPDIESDHMCWRNAFYLNFGGVKIFVQISEQSSSSCIASKTMTPGMKRLTISGQGSALKNGRFIWEGGYDLILQTIRKIMEGYHDIIYEEQVICPACLSKRAVEETHCWDSSLVKADVEKSKTHVNCGNAHRVNTSLLSGSYLISNCENSHINYHTENNKKIKDLMGSFVLVGVYDSERKQIVEAGSGFIVDKDRGLIVTTAHTLMKIEGEKIGAARGDKIVIGVIPQNKDLTSMGDNIQPATFRYFAKIVASDPMIKGKKICTIDTCILQITTKLETDVENCEDLENVPEKYLSKADLKMENLSELKVRESCEIEDRIRIVGFSQGGENLIKEGSWVHRNLGCSYGIVNSRPSYDFALDREYTFSPRKEIIVECNTRAGESGGPCINQQGEVIGILSRGHEDPRCYLVPTSEWIGLLKKAKKSQRRKSKMTIDEFV